jgi:16S rRNA (cytosine1402-N4)-methyltransferase
VPVLVDEVRALLAPERGGVFVDGTVGLGGHARMLLEGGASRLIGIDRDQDALARAAAALAEYGGRVRLVHGDYRELDAVVAAAGETTVAGVLLDLGVSSMQLDEEGRGFSFRRDEPLDMRMDRSRGETAAERLAAVDEITLADVIFRFGEERKSRRVARAIVQAREREPIAKTGQLAAIVRRAVGGPWQRIDPATRTFQALRIWVNGELEGLDASNGWTAGGDQFSLARGPDREARLPRHDRGRHLGGAAADAAAGGRGRRRGEHESAGAEREAASHRTHAADGPRMTQMARPRMAQMHRWEEQGLRARRAEGQEPGARSQEPEAWNRRASCS